MWTILGALLVTGILVGLTHLRRQGIAGDDSEHSDEPANADQPDVYIDHPLEEVSFRVSGSSGLIYMKFYGSGENLEPIPSSHRLYHEAVTGYGDSMTRDQYLSGKPRKMYNT